MTTAKQWRVDIYISESVHETFAEARLITSDTTTLTGRGTARLNPHDTDVPEIGDEVAAGRALEDLGANLLRTAQADIGALETGGESG